MQKYGTDTSAGAGGESPNGNGISPSNKDRDENDVSAFHLVQTPRPALQGEGGIQGGGSSQAASERQRQAEKAKGFKDSGEPLFPINKDTPFAAVSQLDGGSLDGSIRLILFAIFYLVALVLQLKTDDAFYFRSALYTAISEATFEASDGQTGKTIWDVTDRTDTIRWITEVIPDICFSTTAPDQYSTLFPNLPSGLLGTVYTPVVIQDWNVLVGENPVRFSLQVRDRIPKAPEEIVRWVANQQNVSALIDHSLEISEEEQEERLGYIGCYPRGGTDAYGGKAAFVCEMSSDSQIAEAFFARVFERPTWFLEADTQKLVIDFLVYNGNTNIFGYTKIAFEFSDDGSVEKSLSIHEVKAVAAFLLFTMLCSLVSKILIQPFRRVKHFRKAQRRTAEDGEENAPPKGEAERDRDSQFALTPSPEVGKEKAESRESKLSILGGGGYIKEPEKRKSFLREYFTEVGQQFSESVFIPVEVLLVITSIVCAFLWVTYSVNPQADTFSLPSSTSLGIILKAFEGLANRLVIYRRVSALNVMLLFLRMVRLFMFHPRAVTIGEIVLNSFWDNFWFCVMFIVFLIAFSFMGHFAFGGHMEDFSTIERAIESTLYVILGRIRYDEMYEANAAFAGLYFFPLTFLYFFFFRQVLISITLSHTTTRDELQRSGEATTANRLSQSNLLSATGGQSSTTLGEERSVFAGRLVTQQSLGVSEFEYNAWSPRRKTLEERRTETAVMILDCLTGDAEAQKKLPSKLRDYHDKMVKDYHALSDMNSRIGHHTDYGIENAAGAGAGAGAGAKASSAMKEKEATRRSKTGTHRSKTGTKTVAFGAVSKRQLGDGSNFIRSDAPQGGALSTTGSKRKTTTSFFGGMIAKQGDAEEEEHEVSDDEDESLINQREILSRYVVKLEYEIKQLQQDRSREKSQKPLWPVRCTGDFSCPTEQTEQRSTWSEEILA
uniref:Polycystin cation channel PKD1/PKD2 domain-containing protein n=1 Tax=Chromera velia CCMP2878 TaxID=1169474 RepID=A0A0G4HEK2_9ALVE|eukprot:Cvel_958.t1-p1 / transcript=Cvel_958.t1 / gene=Cvel_958 / organism=Chromera_velia_CCMP2878 / gene_product=hypothetical protein / transcript_product=hypothetical protein / location=Cvel_scaffold31:1651-12952(-) / protein_length=948 / sequence_SO=supercontig / SO=protein_coding / is_pseudo=false